jgi:hypothetical protein
MLDPNQIELTGFTLSFVSIELGLLEPNLYRGMLLVAENTCKNSNLYSTAIDKSDVAVDLPASLYNFYPVVSPEDD